MAERNPSQDAYQASLHDDLATLGAHRPEDVQRIAAEAAEQLLHQQSRAEQAEHRADTDQLTGLPNKAAFNKKLQEAVASAESGGRGLGVLFMDLRNFKMINDTRGHAAGDEVIRRVAEVIAANTRQDTRMREADIIANEPQYRMRDDEAMSSRLSGDEFSILLRGVKSNDDLQAVEGNIRDGFYADPFLRDSQVGISVGGALWEPGVTPSELLSQAEQAMYEQKATQGESYRQVIPPNSEQQPAA